MVQIHRNGRSYNLWPKSEGPTEVHSRLPAGPVRTLADPDLGPSHSRFTLPDPPRGPIVWVGPLRLQFPLWWSGPALCPICGETCPSRTLVAPEEDLSRSYGGYPTRKSPTMVFDRETVDGEAHYCPLAHHPRHEAALERWEMFREVPCLLTQEDLERALDQLFADRAAGLVPDREPSFAPYRT